MILGGAQPSGSSRSQQLDQRVRDRFSSGGKNSLTIYDSTTKIMLDSSLKREVTQTTKLASQWDLK